MRSINNYADLSKFTIVLISTLYRVSLKNLMILIAYDLVLKVVGEVV